MAFCEYFGSKGQCEQIVSQVRLNWDTKVPELLLKYPGRRLKMFEPEEIKDGSTDKEEEEVYAAQKYTTYHRVWSTSDRRL